MTTSDTQSTTVEQAADFTKTWRYKIGLTMIIVGNLGILTALVLPALGVGAGTVGAMVVGGEIVSLASIAFLGKAGFKAIKAKFVGGIKASYTRPISKGRHYIGITLFCTAVAANVIIGLFDLYSIDWAANVPREEVLGIGFHGQITLVTWLYIISIISFLVGIYTLGADWWGKFRRLFVWEAHEG